MAIAIRSNGRIFYPFLSAGAFTAAPGVNLPDAQYLDLRYPTA